MAFDASGIFQRVRDWTNDAAAAIKIRADYHDAHDDDIAGGLSECITRTGKSQVTADIPFNNHKITNLGTPVNDADAATKAYADIPKPFTTGATISGADANGRLSFSSPTGANGLSWTGADLSWLARLATAAGPGTPPVPPATLNRLVLNDKPDGSGSDVVEVRDDGSIKAASLTTTGAVGAASVASTNAVTAGGAAYGVDGNITGSVWLNLGYNDAYTAIVQRIEARCVAFTNACFQQSRMAGEVSWVALTNGIQAKQQAAGYVVTATASGVGGITVYARQPQIFSPNGGWVAAFAF